MCSKIGGAALFKSPSSRWLRFIIPFQQAVQSRCAGSCGFPLIKSAAFSAIIRVGAPVLPEVIAGITDASTTRKPSKPNTRSSESTTAVGSLTCPILQVPIKCHAVPPRSRAQANSSASVCAEAGGKSSAWCTTAAKLKILTTGPQPVTQAGATPTSYRFLKKPSHALVRAMTSIVVVQA